MTNDTSCDDAIMRESLLPRPNQFLSILVFELPRPAVITRVRLLMELQTWCYNFQISDATWLHIGVPMVTTGARDVSEVRPDRHWIRPI